jgi:hypothetical protein
LVKKDLSKSVKTADAIASRVSRNTGDVQTASVYAFRTQIGPLEPDHSHAVELKPIHPATPFHVARMPHKVKNFLAGAARAQFWSVKSGRAKFTYGQIYSTRVICFYRQPIGRR